MAVVALAAAVCCSGAAAAVKGQEGGGQEVLLRLLLVCVLHTYTPLASKQTSPEFLQLVSAVLLTYCTTHLPHTAVARLIGHHCWCCFSLLY